MLSSLCNVGKASSVSARDKVAEKLWISGTGASPLCLRLCLSAIRLSEVSDGTANRIVRDGY